MYTSATHLVLERSEAGGVAGFEWDKSGDRVPVPIRLALELCNVNPDQFAQVGAGFYDEDGEFHEIGEDPEVTEVAEEAGVSEVVPAKKARNAKKDAKASDKIDENQIEE